MKDRYKLLIIHCILFVLTLILSRITEKPSWYANDFSWLILLSNTILFLVMVKAFKVKSNSVLQYLLFILAIFIILIIDKDYFYSLYSQSTPTLIFPEGILLISNLLLLPFIYIFDFLYMVNIFNISFVIVPLYIVILIIISKKFIE